MRNIVDIPVDIRRYSYRQQLPSWKAEFSPMYISFFANHRLKAFLILVDLLKRVASRLVNRRHLNTEYIITLLTGK